MSKYLRCHAIYKEKVLDITKQGAMMITMRIVLVLGVKKVAFELSVPFATVGAQQADNDSINPPENGHKNVFLAKSFESNILYSYRKLLN